MTNKIDAWVVPPISNDKILPTTLPPDEPGEFAVHVRACCGQVVPVSFCVRSAEPLVGLTATTRGDLWFDADIRYVKCWWQSGDKTVVHGEPTFTPELLLNDPAMVMPDAVTKRNIIRHPVQDTNYLQPIYLEANRTQQYMVTVKMPDVVRTSIAVHVKLYSQDKTICSLPINIEVLPFALAEPELEYAIYYRGKLVDSDVPTTESEYKTPRQYEAELANMLAHGVTTPICYQPALPIPLGYETWSKFTGTFSGLLYEDRPKLEFLGDLGDVAFDSFDAALKIRCQVGIKNNPLYLTAIESRTGNAGDRARLQDTRIRMLERQLQVIGFDISDVYFYGRDEAQGEELLKQRPAWKAIHEVGGKVFAASYKTDLLKHMGDLIDVAILHHKCVDQLEQWHENGAKVWLYGEPQTTMTCPETYRRNYGLRLLAEGWDGACPYAYQHSYGKSIWNDFDHDRVRDHVMAYPTIDGVVDTLQWEAFREGITDVRYATTLVKLGGKVPDIEGRDLDEVRAEIIDLILQKQGEQNE